MKLTKFRSIIKLIEYICLRCCIFFLKSLPFEVNLKITKILGLILYNFFSKRRTLVENNLKYAFPEKSKEWIQKISRQNFIQTTRLIAEITASQRLQNQFFFKRWVEIKPSTEKYRAILKKGGIFIMGHIGSWEWNGQIGAILLGENIYTFAKKLSNPWVNRYIEKSRNQAGIHLLYIDELPILKAVSLIKKNKILAFISDQYAPNGEYVPFMNRLASTYLGPANFAKLCSTPIYFASSYRDKNGKLVLEIDKIALPKKSYSTASQIDWSKEFTYNWVRLLETKIRAHPADYFWAHDRWKNQPQNEDEIWSTWNIKK